MGSHDIVDYITAAVDGFMRIQRQKLDNTRDGSSGRQRAGFLAAGAGAVGLAVAGTFLTIGYIQGPDRIVSAFPALAFLHSAPSSPIPPRDDDGGQTEFVAAESDPAARTGTTASAPPHEALSSLRTAMAEAGRQPVEVPAEPVSRPLVEVETPPGVSDGGGATAPAIVAQSNQPDVDRSGAADLDQPKLAPDDVAPATTSSPRGRRKRLSQTSRPVVKRAARALRAPARAGDGRSRDVDTTASVRSPYPIATAHIRPKQTGREPAGDTRTASWRVPTALAPSL